MERAGLSQRMVVGYLGPPGTFSEQAALVYKRKFVVQAVSSMEVKLEPMDSILSLILAADKGTLDKAVVPLENSLEGSIALTLDMLAHEVTVRITNEIIVPVRHNLLVKRDIPLVDIKEVISHTQALGQCSAFLRKHLPQAKLTAVNSTAEAAQIVAATKTNEIAAIGTEVAAAVYGVSVLVGNIQDNSTNVTRFCVLSATDAEATGDDKTSLVFSPKQNRAGILYELLYAFANRKIDLTRIESRPAKRILGEYLFFIDIAGHRTEPAVAAALQEVNAASSFFRLLGSYPRWRDDKGE
ncbi:MAG: prephenate dehydratase [Firmicutes bacterium]|nr:prephenate dehydratase [Bacillota bacterium]